MHRLTHVMLAVVAMSFMWVPTDAVAGDIATTRPVPATRPSYDWLKVDEHKQLFEMSCIPMSVEMVLKLLNRVPADYYELQNAWRNKMDGTFGEFDGKTIAGVTFHRQFFLPRNERFPLDRLFDTIDSELDQGRMVIASLALGSGYHMFVIVDKTPSGEYRAVSKNGDITLEIVNVKARIKAIGGTDITTYTADAARTTPLRDVKKSQ
jgi:hypothetical protein